MNFSPWSSVGVLRVGTGNVLAVAMLAVGWLLVDRGADVGSQVAWLNLSIAGLLVALWVNVRWLLDGRRAVGLCLRELNRKPFLGSSPARSSPAAIDSGSSGPLVAGLGLRRYHRSTCPLATGKGWPTASAEVHRAAGRAPCGVCQP